MKIVFSSYHNPKFVTITEYVEEAVKALGHELMSFDDRSFLIPGRIRKRLKFLDEWDLSRINRKFLSLTLQFNPDLCLIAGGHRISRETVKKIRSEGIKTALWTIDPPCDFKPIIEAAPAYDFIFCGGSEAQKLLAEAGIKNTQWLPFACDSSLLKTAQVLPKEEKYSSDIIFVGSFYPNREKILASLRDFNLTIWGPGWEKLGHDHILSKCIRGGEVKHSEWVKIYNSAKIIIVIHYQDGKVICHQASPKLYEALACKRFVLVDDQEDVRSLFEDGKQIVIFKDVNDLRKKIEYYLVHGQERAKIAENGFKEIIGKHTYECRIKQIIDTLSLENK